MDSQKSYILVSMKIDTLLKHMLPSELFEYFDFIDIQESPDDTLTFYLDEKNIIPPEFTGRNIVSNGFDNPITIQDFPLRSKRVYLIVRRHKWKDKHTKKIYSRSWDLTANGTSYSKEFAVFLKELFGQLPDKQ